MPNRFNRLEQKLRSWKVYQLVLVLILVKFTLNIILSEIATSIDPSSTYIESLEEMGLMKEVMLTVFFGPFIETLIFQLILIEILLAVMRKWAYKNQMAIGLATILFALAHSYNMIYQIVMLPMGFIYAWSYVFFRNWKYLMVAFWSVFIIHAMNNLFVLVWDQYAY